ncbi:hypothetical protein C2857_004933 [Epichloe festucae Fl1]|uniref:Uncharacterized protein n=1 Tax=Epichloe festucae (strain Fl1) TaxID=877507 RepID=A0A7U3Q104_EPIFF|nr:hypothetical protein C2857_004933 [Epichloe festucae Fl1]
MLGEKATKTLLWLLVASYGITNFILIIMSLVTNHRTKTQVAENDCRVGRVDCGLTAWGLYPFIAAAATVCFITAFFMSVNIGLRTRKTAAVDPLYVFRGVFFTLLVLTPVVMVGWVEPSHAIYTGNEVWPTPNASYPLIMGEPSAWSRGNAGLVGIPDEKDMAEARLAEALRYAMGGVFSEFVGLTGTFILRRMINLPGESTIMLAHFNIILGAVIAGISAAMAPPAEILFHGKTSGTTNAV